MKVKIVLVLPHVARKVKDCGRIMLMMFFNVGGGGRGR